MSGHVIRELVRKGNAKKIFLDRKVGMYRCSYCALKVQTATVESHLANHTREGKGQFTCKYCCYSSSSLHHEGHHRKYLEKPHKFRCEECRFSGDSQIALDSHLSLNLHKEQHIENLSGEEVKRKKSTLLTMENSGRSWKRFAFNVNNSYRCAFCGMASCGKLAICMHIQRHQTKSDDDSTCQYCSFSCSDNALKSHQSCHKKFILKEHKFRCEYCNFAGDTQLAMNAHLLLGLHEQNNGESSMNCQQRQGMEQEGKTNSSTCDTVKHGHTRAISGDVVQFRRVKDLCMVIKIGGKGNHLCLLCGMGVNSVPSFMKEHERRHHIMVDADHLNKCDYCSYVGSGPSHNNRHKIFLRKPHKFVCDMCNFVCDYKSVLHIHHEVAHHADNTNDMCGSRNLKETSESDPDEAALSPHEDMEVSSDSSNIAGPSSENLRLDCPGSSTSNDVKLVNRGLTESPQLRSIPKPIKTEVEEEDEDDDIEIVSVIPQRRQVPVQRQPQTDIFHCPFCPFLCNFAQVMMTHLYSHQDFTSGQPGPQQPAQPLSVQFPVGATAQPLVHSQPLLQPSQFVPQQTAYWQPQASAGAPQQMMNQVAYTYPQVLV